MPLTETWRRVHRWPRCRRWPLKAVLFAIVLVLVLYPKVWLIPTWIRRLADLNAVVDPQCPGLAELEDAVRTSLPADASLEQVSAAVESTVYERIPYAFDWEVWGVMDYLPTTAEALAQGREDCDGRAVVAASLLRRMGYQAWLASNLEHVWVVAQDSRAPRPCELMSPGAGEKSLAADERGTHAALTLGTVVNLGRGLTYGVAVFPVLRELVLLVALCALAVHPGSGRLRGGLGCLLLAVALAVLRWTGAARLGVAAAPPWAWLALAGMAGGWILLITTVRRRGPDPGP